VTARPGTQTVRVAVFQLCGAPLRCLLQGQREVKVPGLDQLLPQETARRATVDAANELIDEVTVGPRVLGVPGSGGPLRCGVGQVTDEQVPLRRGLRNARSGKCG
jgi:hypothetical protein